MSPPPLGEVLLKRFPCILLHKAPPGCDLRNHQALGAKLKRYICNLLNYAPPQLGGLLKRWKVWGGVVLKISQLSWEYLPKSAPNTRAKFLQLQYCTLINILNPVFWYIRMPNIKIWLIISCMVLTKSIFGKIWNFGEQPPMSMCYYTVLWSDVRDSTVKKWSDATRKMNKQNLHCKYLQGFYREFTDNSTYRRDCRQGVTAMDHCNTVQGIALRGRCCFEVTPRTEWGPSKNVRFATIK